MKKMILLLSLTFGLLTVCDAQKQTEEIKTKGVFSEIEVDTHNKIITTLQGEDKKAKDQAIATILKTPNSYNPPVLYELSRVLFLQGNKDEAAFWFYVAQLRARYDV